MKSLAGWFYANKLSLNIQKNNFLVFSPKNMDNVMTAIKLGNQQILQVRNTKFLGIYIDDGLEWGDHINHITKEIASGANKVCTYSVDFNTFRVEMFDTFREPHFFTFSVIFSHIASIFTFSVEFFFTFSYLFTCSGIFTFEGATGVRCFTVVLG